MATDIPTDLPLPVATAPAKRFRNKTLLTALSTFFALLGLHRFYLGGRSARWAWCYPAWFMIVSAATSNYLLRVRAFDWLHPLFLLSFLPVVAGTMEAIYFTLTPDEKFDARYNDGTGRHNRTGGLCVALAALSLALTALMLMSLLALTMDTIYQGDA